MAELDGARLQNYEAFLAVVEEGNLTSAAKRLGRSLQSISRSLSALEKQLGVTLIRRTTRRAQPTDAGEAFHHRVRSALSELAAAEADIRDTASTLSGSICVAASAFIAAHYIVPAIRDFVLQHPQVSFDLRISERFSEPVSSGADLMLRVGTLPSSPLKARKVGALRRAAVASPAYLSHRGRPRLPSELASHNCLVRNTAQDARTWSFISADGKRERVEVSGNFVSDNAYVVNHAVLAGLGIAIVPVFQMRAAIEAGQAEILLEDFTLPPSPVHAVLASTGRAPIRVRRFIDLLTNRFRRDLA